LYIGSNGGAMIHELDVRTAEARCIDLPGTGDYGSAASWALVMSHDGGTLWGVSPGYGRVVGIDVVTRKVRTAFRLAIPKWTLGTATSAALAPDGKRVALAEGKNIAVVDLAARTIASHGNVHALALGYSPDQTRLWVVGERSRVTALPVS
jgi:hypothetical protein